ncbi:MAG: iron-containing redox enzyme family protein, partial [Moorea sp. SIO3G5]|nr:iron-containing redox enzyme family protein [Moorena sp. SIO3G5]
SIGELQELFAPDNPEVIQAILQGLEEQALLDDATPFKVHSGIDTLLELEDFTNELLETTVEGNLFWKAITSNESELPINVLYGFGIEHYHLSCHRWNWEFPVLGCQNYTKVRQLINQLSGQESGQDQLWLKALNGIGISDEDLKDAIALPETVAIGNALAYWANSEPLVFLSNLGVLKRQTYHHLASYLAACERVNLESGFIDPIRELVNSNLTVESENLIHRIFQDIAHVDQQTRQRLGDQIYLFIEMYNNFCRAIWNYYSCTSDLLRRVSAL